jgi:hypothetical protein
MLIRVLRVEVGEPLVAGVVAVEQGEDVNAGLDRRHDRPLMRCDVLSLGSFLSPCVM